MNSHKLKHGIVIALLLSLGIFLFAGLSLAQETPGANIQLQFASFDPLQGEPFTPPDQSLRAQADGPQLYLVQFVGPVQAEWKAAAEAAGARLYGYIPDFAFIARLDAGAAAELRQLSFVRWVGDYHPAYRLPSDLQAALADAAAAGDSAAQAESALELVLQTLPDADLDQLAVQIRALGGEVTGATANALAGYIRVAAPALVLSDLAALDGVVWVEQYFAPELHNDIGAGGIMHTGVVQSILGLSGQGQTVAVADSGLDTGSTTGIHPDFMGRVLKAYCLGRPSPCDWSDYVGHGTHVAGSVLGSGAASGGQYKGSAPQASLVFQSLSTSIGTLQGIPDDRGDLMRQAYDDGARIHTNSWGGSTGGSSGDYGDYVSSSQQVDQAMWEMKDLLVLYSAGNNGADVNQDGLIDNDSIGQPGTAKNILTVGASENNRPTINRTWGSSYGAPITTDLRADNPDGMAAFSSRGPTDDGRIKPEVAAPGTFIASTHSRQYAFNDNLEAATTPTLYEKFANTGGALAGTWVWTGETPHSGAAAWKATASGFSADYLLSPAFNATLAYPGVTLSFFHKYTVAGDDRLLLLVADDSRLGNPATLALNYSGSTATYQRFQNTFSIAELAQFVNTGAMRFGFAILPGANNVFDGTQWWIDDIRVEGLSWGLMSEYGLALPGDATDDSYVMQGGTSMSTPLTAGAAALAREWLTTLYTSMLYPQHVANPSGALLKAVLINGAADMSPGQYTSPQEIPAQMPNFVNGWGRVDLLGSLMPANPAQIWLVDEKAGLASGQNKTYNLTVVQPSGGTNFTAEAGAGLLGGELATLVDPAAAAAAPAPGRTVELRLDSQPVDGAPASQAPAAADAAVALVIDDGQAEEAYGVNDTINGVAHQFLWFNRFTPSAADFPFTLNEIHVLFDNFSGTYDFSAGDPIDLVVYRDADSDPSNGATHLATFNATIQSANGSAWSVYTLSTPVTISQPGDVLIGVIDRFVQDGVTASLYPALTDQTTIQGRSWLGWWNATPPNPPALPTDNTMVLLDGAGGGNFLIRGYGETATPPPTGTGGPLRITLAWTDSPGQPAAAKALVNDLDLEVIGPDGTHYYGNAGAYSSISGYNCVRGSFDSCNVVESVYLPTTKLGAYQVIVHGYNVSVGPQPFAVVASGDCLLGSCFVQDQSLYLPLMKR